MTMINGLKTLTARELRAMKFPAPEYLLEPWLSVGESVMVYSPPGVGKSLFAMSTALAVSGAGEFLGWKSPKARKTLLVDGEMPERVLRDRMNLLVGGIVPV